MIDQGRKEQPKLDAYRGLLQFHNSSRLVPPRRKPNREIPYRRMPRIGESH